MVGLGLGLNIFAVVGSTFLLCARIAADTYSPYMYINIACIIISSLAIGAIAGRK